MFDSFKLGAKNTAIYLVGGQLTESGPRKMVEDNMRSALRHEIGDEACKKKTVM